MCCGHDNHHGGGRGGSHLSSPCACGGHADIEPCFWTKREKIAYLEKYLADLEIEGKFVGERIASLKGED